MITYELAKQLKDAGFIFKEINKEQSKLFKSCWVEKNLEEDVRYFMLPTLSELISACDREFMSLDSNGDNTWSTNYEEGCMELARYKTPEEAVAHLWLELNKVTKNKA